MDSFIRAYEKRPWPACRPNTPREFMEAMSVGRQSFVETYVLLTRAPLSSKNLLTEEQSGKRNHRRKNNVRGVAFPPGFKAAENNRLSFRVSATFCS